MTDFFFPDNKCGIGNKVEKPQFKFVADCLIEPTPKPIYDCPLPIIAREPEIPCPEFNVTSKLEVGFTGSNEGDIENCDITNKLKFDIKKKVSDVCPADANNCEFDVDLEVNIAIPLPPCPTIKVNTFSVKSGFKDQPCVEDESRFTIISRKIPGNGCDDPGSCEFEVDLDIVVPIPRPPCPEINVRTFNVVSDYADSCTRGQNRFEISTQHRQPEACDDPGECKFDVDLEIYVPIPRPPCPEIKITSFKVESKFTSDNCVLPPNKFEIRKRFEAAPCDDPTKPPLCEFEVDLEINIPIPQPPCPEIKVTSFKVSSGYANSECANGVNKFTIEKREIPGGCDNPTKCEFDVALEINIPIPQPPCPKINIKKFEVKSGYPDCVPPTGGRFAIVTRHTPPENCKDDAGKCEFDFELEISVQIPKPPCPEIRVKTFDVKIGYPFLVCDPTPDGQCSGPNKFVITRKDVPPPCDDPNRPATCEFDIELLIFIPPPKIPCPVIRIKKFEVKTGYEESVCVEGGQNRFEITSKIIPCTCDEPERCEFDVELEIVVPIPKPPCPVFNVTKFKVRSKYETQPCGDSVFVIKKKDKPWLPNECTLPEDETKCEFDIELEINVPIPEPPCPVINIKKFEVKSDYQRCITGENTFTVNRRYKPPAGDCDNPQPAECEFDFEILINVPIPEPPCPDIDITSFAVRYIDYDIRQPPPNLSGCNRFRVTKTSTPPACTEDGSTPPECSFDIELELCIPQPRINIPCPRIVVRNFIVKSQYSDCPQGRNVFIVDARDNGGVCEFNIDLEISIPIPRPPCPIFGTSLTLQTGLTGCIPPGGQFVVVPAVQPGGCENPDICAFLFAINLNIPIPRFVSDVAFTTKAGNIKVTWCPPGNNPVASTAKVTFNRQANLWAGACDRGNLVWYETQLDLDIVIPRFPCEYIKLVPFRDQYKVRRICQPAAEEYIKMFIRPAPNQGGGCAPCIYEFDFDIQLRQPCRTRIFAAPGQLITNGCYDTTTPNTLQPPSDPDDPFGGGGPTTGGSIGITITREPCGEGTNCYDQFTLTPYLELPPPKIPCPEFYAANRVKIELYDNLVQLPYGDLRFEPVPKIDPCDPCVFDVYLDLYLPKPCVPTFKFNSGRSVVNPCYYTKDECPGQDPVEVYIEEIEPCVYEVYTYSKPSIYMPPDLVCDEFITTNSDVYYLENPNDPPRVELKIEPRAPSQDDDHCTYDVSLDIYVAKGCVPTFKFNSGRSQVNPCYYTKDECPGLDPVEVYIEEVEPCVYEVYTYSKPSIYVPEPSCPEIWYSPGSFRVVPVPWAPNGLYDSPDISFTPSGFTEDGRCRLELSGEIYVPEPCEPEFSFDSAGSSINPCYYTKDECPGLDPVEVYIEKVPGSPGECEYKIRTYYKPSIYQPPDPAPCDTFNGSVDVQWAASTAQPSGTITISPSGDRSADGSCTYTVELDLSIPRCEPNFYRGSQYVNVYRTSNNPSGSINVSITKNSGCDYNVNADLTLYIPQSTSNYVVVRNQSADWISCGSSPTLSVNITPPNQNGVQYMDIAIGIPQPPNYIGDTWTIAGGLGTATSMVESSGCNRKIGGSIELYTTSCPPTASPFTMPMTENPAVEPDSAVENRIMTLWDDPAYVDGFITALETNDRLRNVVKNILTDM